MSLSVIDKITGAGVVQFSPANTSRGLRRPTTDKDLYFRTAPSDVLQGAVLANLVVEDGFNNVAILARQDFYGEGLAEQVEKALEARRRQRRRLQVLYAADATELHRRGQPDRGGQARRARAGRLRRDHEDHPAADRQGHRPAGHPDLLRGRQHWPTTRRRTSTSTGVKGTCPVSRRPDPDFNDRLLEIDPKLKDFTYGPESYDAAIIIALAAIAAERRPGEAIAPEIINVTAEGTECTDVRGVRAAARGRRGHRLRGCLAVRPT